MKTLMTFTIGFATAMIVVFASTAWTQKPVRANVGIIKPGDLKPMSGNENERETSICHNCNTDPFKEVPLKKFFKDVARYHGTHGKDVRSEMNGARTGLQKQIPSRMCMYTLDTLKKFICFIETYAAEAGLNTRKDPLGINFYYAVYPLKESINGQEYGSLHTLYLVPTYYNPIKKMQLPFDVKGFVDAKKKDSTLVYPKSLGEQYTERPGDAAFILNAVAMEDTNASGSVINQGQLCPPACKDELPLEVIGYREY